MFCWQTQVKCPASHRAVRSTPHSTAADLQASRSGPTPSNILKEDLCKASSKLEETYTVVHAIDHPAYEQYFKTS